MQTTLGERVRAHCGAHGLTYRDAAAQLGIAPGHLCHLVSGQRRPSVTLLARLAAWLDVPADALLAPASPDAPDYRARHTAPLVTAWRGLASAVATWQRAVEDRSLAAETELERARLDGEAAAYARVAAALRNRQVGA